MSDRIATFPGVSSPTEASALAELVLCENLSQTSGWAARWSGVMSGADAALLWSPHSVNPQFLCIGAWGEGTEKNLRRAVSRDEGIVHRLLRDRLVLTLERAQISGSSDPWLAELPSWVQTCIAIPLEADRLVVGLLALLFRERPNTSETVTRIESFVRHAAPALARALRAERKIVGMLHAIERLTNLHDLSKAFNSTIDLHELSEIIVNKAVDFANAEVASLWMLEPAAGEVLLAATALNNRFPLEDPPQAVGSSIVGDVLADRNIDRRNDVELEEGSYVISSVLALPFLEDGAAIGALVITNKRGRHPEFTVADEELLVDLVRQAVRALHNAKLYEAEKKVEELDALLAVSREITSTLDLDRVLKTIVNASSALITFDRSAIAILQRGNLHIGAVSGALEVNRKDPAIQRLEEILQWVFFSGSEVAVTADEQGHVESDRPETEEKFRSYFEETGMRSFYAALLQDEEGKLGVLSFESQEPIVFDQETRDLVQILQNQATVAVRNAQLYQQMPLVGIWKPLMAQKRKFESIPRARQREWAIGAGIVLLLLILIPWPLRVEGTTRVVPIRRVAVTAPVDGVVQAVQRREGDVVRPGDVIATLRDDPYQAALAEARSALEIAQSEVARYRTAGDPGAMFRAQARRDELQAKIRLAQEQLARTQIRADTAGVLLTPHIEERVGQFLSSGTELAVIGDVSDVIAEVAVPEVDSSLLKVGQAVAIKIHPYPTRTYRGQVTRVGAVVRQEGEERFVIADARVANPDQSLRAGMLGRGKISVGRRQMIVALLRKPLRYLWLKFWPMLP